jgi:predicted ATPase/class 3 adenylate cyclase
VRLAAGLAAALGDVHRANVVHKDVKPSNVVLNRETGVLKLIDFDISSQLSRENPSLAAPGSLEGTLAYLSPEQSGRMNRSIDSRSDLYSLGVTLFELLTGRLPFTSADPMELVRDHIAVAPPSPRELDASIPDVVAAITLKLMAKRAEARYQSAWGVLRDLERCLVAWEGGAAPTFTVGADAVSDRFQIPQRLYGRERETEGLLEAFARAADGGREVLLVAGFSGIGKSALIQEVHRPIAERQGFYCAGKFDQFRRDLPYQALIDALRDLIRQLLTEAPARVAVFRRALDRALAGHGRVIADVVPELTAIMGEQSPVEDLDPGEAQARFNRVFGAFLRVFARREHPLTVVLDDLQWADPSSLTLLRALVTDAETTHLLVVGAYRDNEVSDSHPLAVMVRDVEAAGQPIGRLALRPLDAPTVGRLVADTFHRDDAPAHELGRVVHDKTQGNPFFVGEFLRTLYRDGHVNFDPARGRWVWDAARVASLGITDNVVELVAARLRALPPDTRATLELAACVGSRFDLQTLSVVLGRSLGVTARALSPALRDGFVLPLDDTYKYVEASDDDDGGIEGTAYRFVHDRVQHAAYTLLDEGARKRQHLSIGRLLLERLSARERDEALMDIANHFDMARDLVTDPRERRQLAELHDRAGRRALAAMAAPTAAHYLESALSLLAPDAWETDYRFTLALHTEATEAMFLCERYDEMESLAAAVLARAKDVRERVAVERVRITARQSQGRSREALELARPVLATLGVHLPDDAGMPRLLAEMARTRLAIGRRRPMDLVALPELKDPTILATLDLCRQMASITYFVNPRLMLLIVMVMVRLSLEHGNSTFAANGYLLYGMTLCGTIEDFDTGHEFGRLAFKVLERFPSPNLAGKMAMIWGTFVAPWKSGFAENSRQLLAGWRPGVDGGDIEYASYALLQGMSMGFCAGAELNDLLARFDEGLRWLHGTRQVNSWPLMDSWVQAARNLVAGPPAPPACAGSLFDLTRDLPAYVAQDNKIAIAYATLADGMLAVIFKDRPRARARFELTRRYEEQLFACFMLTALAFYEALNDLAMARDAAPVEAARLRARAARNELRLRRYARFAPMNNAHKLALVRAERCRVEGDRARARGHYREAIELAARSGFQHEEALACELCGEFWLEEGERDAAHAYLARARHGYEAWGAALKVADLDARHGGPAAAPRASGVGGSVTSTVETHAGDLDVESVLRASQAISSEVVLSDLLKRLMSVVLENAAAQRGVLLLDRGGELRVEAQCVAGTEAVVLRSLTMDVTDADGGAIVPAGLVHYVARTREALVLDDASADERFRAEPYVAARRPRSVLCGPVLRQGRLVGVLYLENNLASGAFTSDRIRVLELLSGQIAVSIANAELYETLEEKVRERTEQLEVRNRFIRQTFGRYLSNDVVDSILETPEGLELGGARRRVTIMLSDLRGFSSHSERLTPEQVVSLLNNYLSEMTEVILKYQGTIDEFIGDAILTIFGAPLQRADDTERAVACALEMQVAMGRVNDWNRRHGMPEIEMGIGINTGEVVVGNIGSQKRAKYGVVGSQVNLAGRAESYTVGGQVLVSEATLRSLRPAVRVDARFEVHPKGAAQPLALYEIGAIGEPYAITLNRVDASLATLVTPEPVALWEVHGKGVAGEAQSAAIVRLSAREGELVARDAPATLTDLRIKFPTAGAPDDDVYAKVVRCAAGGGTFTVRFTSLPEASQAWLAALPVA